MRLRTAMAAAVVLPGLMLGAGVSSASEAEPSKLACKLAGLRYVGTGASKGRLCFTLTANRRTMRENAVEVCRAAEGYTSSGRSAKRVAVKASGTFSTTKQELALGGSGDLGSLEWVNITFSGRIKSNRASGTLVVQGTTSGTKYRCTWSARQTG